MLFRSQLDQSSVKESAPIERIAVPYSAPSSYPQSDDEDGTTPIPTKGSIDIEELKKYEHPDRVDDIINYDFSDLLEGATKNE